MPSAGTVARTGGIAAALLWAGLGMAWAQSGTESPVGHWTVVQLPASCHAVNRPVREVNFAPWNSMSLVMRRDGGVLMNVCFWPGAVPGPQVPEVRAVIRLKPTHRVNVMMQDASSNGCYFSSAALPVDLLAEMRQAEFIQINILPVILEFDTRDLGGVLDQLEACRATRR